MNGYGARRLGTRKGNQNVHLGWESGLDFQDSRSPPCSRRDGDTLVAILAEPNGAAATRSLHRFLIAYSLASLLWGSLTSFCCGNNLV